MEQSEKNPRHLVITVHGIRTFGRWQERLEALLRANAGPLVQLTVVHYKFGYFSVFAFVSIFLRWLAVRRFRAELLALAKVPWDRIDIVAHSFGTFLVAKTLQSLSSESKIRIDTLILAGSVLPDHFRWNKLLAEKVSAVVNECGAKDNVVLLSQALPFLGMAGRTGFRGVTGRNMRNRFFNFGHSGYFLKNGKPDDDFMRSNWLPILLSREEAPPVDERSANAFSGIEAFLLNNSRPIKAVAYLALLAVLFLRGVPWVSSVYAGQLVSKENGYITKGPNGTKVWFDEDAGPTSAIRWLAAVGPIHELNLESTKIHDSDVEAIPSDETFAILELGDTKITHLALPSLGRFPGLKRLRLFHDPLGSLDGLPQWSGIETLDLEGTGIKDNDLSWIARLTALRQLNLSDNGFQGGGLTQLAMLTNLTELVINDEKALDDQSLAYLPPLRSLKKLSLRGDHIRGEGLIYLRELDGLSSLSFAFTNVTNAGLLNLPKLPQLRVIILEGANITGTGFEAFSRLPSIEEPWMKDTQVTSSSLARLTPLHNLRILVLAGTKVGQGALSHLKELSKLEELYLGGVEIEDEDLGELRVLPKLRVLYLPQNPQITDAGLARL